MSDDLLIAGRVVQPALNRVRGDTGEIAVEPKVMAVLLVLAGSPGEVFSREQVLDAVWGDQAVSDDVLTRSIVELRRIFGDSSSDPRVIETIRTRGYRLIAEVGPVPSSAPASDRFVPSRVLMVGAVLLSMAVGLAFLRSSTRDGAPAPEAGAQPLRITPLTGSAMEDHDAAVSPDGTRVAFIAHQGRDHSGDIYVALLDGESPLRLTDHELDDRYPVFSPDGTELAFVRRGEEACGRFLISTTGGTPRRFGECDLTVPQRMAWSPDGLRMAVTQRVPDGGPHWGLWVLPFPTTAPSEDPALEPHPLTTPAEPYRFDHEPAYSPDGRHLAFLRSMHGRVGDLFVVELFGGEPRRLTFDHRHITGVTFSPDGESLIFSSDRGGDYSLWRIALAGGEPTWITGGGAKLKRPSQARQADVLAYDSWQVEYNVWRLPLDGDEPASPFVVSSQWDFDARPSPTGDHVAFVSTRSGSHEIWTAGVDGEDPIRLTRFDAAFTGTPRWAPDGENLLFVSFSGGQPDLYRIALGETSAQRLTQSVVEEQAPSWSRNGEWIYFGADLGRGRGWEVLRIPAQGGEPTTVVADGASVAQESWDGADLYWTRRQESGLWRVTTADPSAAAAELVTSDFPADRIGDWIAGPEGIYYFDVEDGEVLLKLWPYSGGPARRLRTMPYPDRPGLGLVADGSYLLYAQSDRRSSDVLVARNLP